MYVCMYTFNLHIVVCSYYRLIMIDLIGISHANVSVWMYLFYHVLFSCVHEHSAHDDDSAADIACP